MKKNSTISGHLQVNGHALDIEYGERDVVVDRDTRRHDMHVRLDHISLSSWARGVVDHHRISWREA